MVLQDSNAEAYLVTFEAAPPHIAPRPPWKGIMKGNSFSGGNNWQAGRDWLPIPEAPPGCAWESGEEALVLFLAKTMYWSQTLVSGVIPAAAKWTGKRSYCVLYGPNCNSRSISFWKEMKTKMTSLPRSIRFTITRPGFWEVKNHYLPWESRCLFVLAAWWGHSHYIQFANASASRMYRSAYQCFALGICLAAFIHCATGPWVFWLSLNAYCWVLKHTGAIKLVIKKKTWLTEQDRWAMQSIERQA